MTNSSTLPANRDILESHFRPSLPNPYQASQQALLLLSHDACNIFIRTRKVYTQCNTRNMHLIHCIFCSSDVPNYVTPCGSRHPAYCLRLYGIHLTRQTLSWGRATRALLPTTLSTYMYTRRGLCVKERGLSLRTTNTSLRKNAMPLK